jgi:FMN phosphatase YigB (HAD superfamily)
MTNAISPHQLATLLNEAPGGVSLLSLDCFDTLIWRNVHAPTDVFNDLGEDGPSRQQRIWAEVHARSRATLRKAQNEATIGEIYDALLPDHGEEGRAVALAAELEAEARHCYAFAPTVELMRAAKRTGLSVAIVSDTYLDKAQLTELIRRAAGEEVVALIDHIFCSSEYGVSKGEGLFKHVLHDTGLAPAQILHIGDNKAADFTAARALGLHALHLKQFAAADQQRLRLEAAVGAIVNAGRAAQLPTHQPHRAAIALTAPTLTDPATALGYATLGPVLHAYSGWLADETKALHQEGTRTHLLFLMRDGYLPQRVFDVADGGIATTAIEISRFTSTAASFTDEAAVLDYLEIDLEGGDYEALARQLLFDKDEIAVLLRKLPSRRRDAAFVTAIRSPANMRKILTRSSAFAERLTAYVRRQVDPRPGDTVVLADLGYNGTVQDRIEPLLRQAFGVAVAGRYLLLREQKVGRRDKRGLIDARHYDSSTLEAFCANVAVIEQLCTAAQGSVVDYDRAGLPVRATSGIKARQSSVRERVQQGCVRFAAERDAAFVRAPRSDGHESRRQAAAATLARLMFLPLPSEIEVLAGFEHDVNLGTDGTVKLFDTEVAARGLRRRGLFYMKGADRMYLPAELRGQGLPSSLTLLTQHRFGLDLRYADFTDRSINVPIIVADGNEVAVDTVQAHPTHDGYFMAAIPVGESRYAIGVQFGRLYEWVQVDSAQFVPVDTFLSDKAAQRDEPIDALPSLEGMEQVAPHLLRCEDAAAFMMVPPPKLATPRSMMLTVVFRPIAARELALGAGAKPHLDARRAGVAR